MWSASFAARLAALDAAELTDLLAARPDVRVEPVPRSFEQLAQRLGGPGSIVEALRLLNHDTHLVGEAIAVLGDGATVPAIARLLDTSEPAVHAELAMLRGIGLAWSDGQVLRLPERLQEHWRAELGDAKPLAQIAKPAYADDLRVTASAWDIPVAGARKPELIDALTEMLADPKRVAARIAELPNPARDLLDELRSGLLGVMFGYVDPRRSPVDVLVRAGLVLLVNRRPEVPREVAVGAWLAGLAAGLTGRPEVAKAEATATAADTIAQGAAREAVHILATLLDEAGRKPVAMLKKGGVGAREQGNLAKRLSIPVQTMPLWIDIAYAAELLGETDGGYAPTAAHSRWRAATPSEQWAAAATAWYAIEHAPLLREVNDDKVQPPPLPLVSEAGAMRRALVRTAAADGLSVRGVGGEIDWFYPMHGYDAAARDAKIAAVIQEAELLGVVAQDRVSELGATIVDANPDSVADRCAALLPATECRVILQSDLTAVVSGQPSAAVANLLAAAAVNETRGAGAVWRFSANSVRGALDAGWTAPELLAELAAIAHQPLPQPLEYLVNDTARRHGRVRVRATRSCLVADEAMVAEIAGTRSLAKLKLVRAAPTVLTSPLEPDRVLDSLRAAGFFPVVEDATGAVVVERVTGHLSDTDPIDPPRPTLDASELARRLVADPNGDHAKVSRAERTLAGLNPRLDDAELALLAHAIEHRDDVVISYRNKEGNRTIRRIRPIRLWDRWMESYCHLRGADREFTVANIEAVSPAR
ncbi:helicase-associated domain-containing protein [Labedaea rhizosphaerae]|uniref:helicase-associated domain-containing protein n=1 Tax=Labedaea rhizosphaerae TaxID=598644 RepID=UPI00105D7A7B|nr:helicase-associated domain-containing protein [Labedaea rhizosphaerae]